ncbi:MAG: DUF1638 domain-containing protein [Tepidanaerobacteraceae bacterium]|jgi:hypothetical protein|nr:DUF1638 domain-containing protein [Tepidanaerobacteraceae bacterium]
MKNIIIACRTLYDELNLAISNTNCEYPVIWVDSEYHSDPNRLRSKLQQEIDAQDGFDNILLAYGFCGNAILDLKASTANLIFPKTDDCISMLLSRPKEKFERMKATYFLTKGWIESSKSIMKEYLNAVSRYGEKRTRRIFQIMLKHYNKLMLIDTGAYNVEDYREEACKISKIADLEVFTGKGGIWMLEKLVAGPYDDDFIIIEKGNSVNVTDLGYVYDDKLFQNPTAI